jgi:hypothetical protein
MFDKVLGLVYTEVTRLKEALNHFSSEISIMAYKYNVRLKDPKDQKEHKITRKSNREYKFVWAIFYNKSHPKTDLETGEIFWTPASKRSVFKKGFSKKMLDKAPPSCVNHLGPNNQWSFQCREIKPSEIS